MMHTANAIYDNLGNTLLAINKQIDATTKDVEKQIAVLPYPDGVTVYDMKGGDGQGVLAPLLAAKAQVLSAMAALKTAEMQQRGKR